MRFFNVFVELTGFLPEPMISVLIFTFPEGIVFDLFQYDPAKEPGE